MAGTTRARRIHRGWRRIPDASADGAYDAPASGRAAGGGAKTCANGGDQEP